MKLHFIIPRNQKNWAFPLIKWRNKLLRDKINVKIHSDLSLANLNSNDLVVLTDHTYARKVGPPSRYTKKYNDLIIADLEKCKSANCRVIFYDGTDGPGARHLWLIQHVDMVLKRQIFNNKSRYSSNNGTHPMRPWVVEEDLELEGCDPKYLDQLQIGWNLGYFDYYNLSRLISWLRIVRTKFPEFFDPANPRPITTSFRGASSGSRAHQREKVREIIQSYDTKRYITGPKLNKKEYLEELKNTKAAVSPFGYGELCWRDFEAVICGSVLIKPDVSHLKTFPEFYEPHSTYIPIKWDISNLDDIFDKIETGNINSVKIAKNAQKKYEELYNSYDLFYNHLKTIIDQVYS